MNPVHVPSWSWAFRAMAAVAAMAALIPVQAATSSGFTKEQAKQGGKVYSQQCAKCHGAQLKGGAAPALIGDSWHQSIANRFGTAAALLDYVSKNMPVNNPGGLSQEQYRDAVAFLLVRNGYDSTKTQSAQLDTVKLTPVPQSSGGSQTQLEVQNIGDANRTIARNLPDAGRVKVNDQMMLGAADDKSNWLLHGRDYTNQRYSPLDQIRPPTSGRWFRWRSRRPDSSGVSSRPRSS